MVAICIELLDGQYAGTTADRTRCDWPPSPQRLFLALVATAYHAGLRESCAPALVWLAGLQTHPEIQSGWVNQDQLTRSLGVYVPANYVLSEEKQVEQGWLLGRKELAAFSVTPSDHQLAYVWPSENLPPSVEPRLCELLAHVAFLGRSESQVRAYVCVEKAQVPSLPITYSATNSSTVKGQHLAAIFPGILEAIEEHWNRATADYEKEISQQAAKKARSKKRQAKDSLADVPRAEVLPFPEQLPVIYYRRLNQLGASQHMEEPPKAAVEWLRTVRHELGRTIPLAFAPLLAADIRERLVQRQRGGLMVVPLPFVVHPNADGLVKGIAFLHDQTSPGEAESSLRQLVGEFQDASLPNGEHRFSTPSTITPTLSLGRWSRPSRLWTSVTPVILPAFPKPKRLVEDVTEAIRKCCEFVGISESFELEFDRSSPLRGVPKTERFRLPERYQHRPTLHIVLRFSKPVRGPLVLGVGRYLGIGLCVPLEEA